MRGRKDAMRGREVRVEGTRQHLKVRNLARARMKENCERAARTTRTRATAKFVLPNKHASGP